MIRTVKLEHYLPPYIQEYREIWKLMQAENPEFQLADDESEKIKNNLFIENYRTHKICYLLMSYPIIISY